MTIFHWESHSPQFRHDHRELLAEELYSEAVADAHRNADFHNHDLSMFSGYCAAGRSVSSLKKDWECADKITSRPARQSPP
jgi:anaerobic ribonucleoside-triphosphate reductase